MEPTYIILVDPKDVPDGFTVNTLKITRLIAFWKALGVLAAAEPGQNHLIGPYFDIENNIAWCEAELGACVLQQENVGAFSFLAHGLSTLSITPSIAPTGRPSIHIYAAVDGLLVADGAENEETEE